MPTIEHVFRHLFADGYLREAHTALKFIDAQKRSKSLKSEPGWLMSNMANAVEALGQLAEAIQSRRGRASGRVDQPLQQQQQGGEEVGPDGPVYREFGGKPAEAAGELRRRKTGEVPGALFHPQVGYIDLIFGKASDPKRNFKEGYGSPTSTRNTLA